MLSRRRDHLQKRKYPLMPVRVICSCFVFSIEFTLVSRFDRFNNTIVAHYQITGNLTMLKDTFKLQRFILQKYHENSHFFNQSKRIIWACSSFAKKSRRIFAFFFLRSRSVSNATKGDNTLKKRKNWEWKFYWIENRLGTGKICCVEVITVHE